MPLLMDGSIQVAPSTVARSVEARSRRQPIPADFSPLRCWSRKMAVHRRGRKKPIALPLLPSVSRSVEARSRRQPIPADFSPLRCWLRTTAVHRRGRKKPIALPFIPSARKPTSLPLPEKGRGRVVSPSPLPLGQGASRDPKGAVRRTDGLSRRKGGRGESTGLASPGEPRPPLPSKGIPRDKRG